MERLWLLLAAYTRSRGVAEWGNRGAGAGDSGDLGPASAISSSGRGLREVGYLY
jgi:hypothetical protein